MILLKAVANLTVYRSDHTSPCCLPKEWLQELVSLQVRVVCMELPNLPLPEQSDSNLLTRQALPEVFYLSILMLVKLQKKINTGWERFQVAPLLARCLCACNVR